jgi:hypothetical protein
MKLINATISGILLALFQTQTYAAGDADPFAASTSDTREYLQLADNDDRQDRRDERGRSDERQDKRDCRQDEGYVGKDKRDCKQEEVRDGVRGNQGGSDNDD